MNKCICNACKSSIEHDQHPGNTGPVAKATGYTPFFLYSSEMVWLCPSCVEKIKPAAKLILEMLGEYAMVPTLRFSKDKT